MYCNKCGAKIPDDSVFCGNCGEAVGSPAGSRSTPIPTSPRETPPIIQNLLNTLRLFFSREPESSLPYAGASQTHEWAILIGVNVLIFAFAYAVNSLEVVGSLLSSLVGEFVPLEASDIINFGYFFLFGLLISLIANGIVFGAYYLLHKVILRGDQDIIGMLNTVAVSTVPFTVVCVLNMILGLIWGFMVIPFVLIAALAQVLLLYLALQQNAGDKRVGYIVFLGVCLAALFLTLLFGFLFTKAGFNASL